MPTTFIRPILAALALLAGAASAQDCERPWPVGLPAAAPEETEAMLELRDEVQQYLAKAQAYLDCNKAETDIARKAIADTDDALIIQEHEQEVRSLVSRYNQTVDEMHAVGNQFNRLLREFKGEGDGEPDSGEDAPAEAEDSPDN